MQTQELEPGQKEKLAWCGWLRKCMQPTKTYSQDTPKVKRVGRKKRGQEKRKRNKEFSISYSGIYSVSFLQYEIYQPIVHPSATEMELLVSLIPPISEQSKSITMTGT